MVWSREATEVDIQFSEAYKNPVHDPFRNLNLSPGQLHELIKYLCSLQVANDHQKNIGYI